MWDMVYINAQDAKQRVLELLGDDLSKKLFERSKII